MGVVDVDVRDALIAFLSGSVPELDVDGVSELVRAYDDLELFQKVSAECGVVIGIED